ncbi:DHA2 family efflux MFS transporter permease subunit [Actinoplanes sp. KI2]|uniref:DHA2 family efflux MFS transporter permease subunit n=1 Tax=Actinoplanes sp. KI2 TaxID=2983315 RepID=UPI0021D5F4AE|nr:DHA2 family efflux MFS transporter permease subunit [Actinoplanes sp. KI2]MCU7725381.1 DHA2 family efflux MFS transporter permease subunit [Actinoplanes sp. KI2]
MTMTTTITRTQRWVLGLSALASFMVVLDLLVVATALPSIRRDLGASLEDLEWTVNAYTLSFAVLIMTGAALGDRLGRRRMFAAGLVLFAAASAACALASSVGTLVVARTVQGAGAAMIMPLALALLNAAFPPERRGWATGVYGSVTALAVVLGPVLGGAVTQGLAWPWIFWINVPIALLAAPLVSTRVPESRGAGTRIDGAGLLLGGLAATGLVWALVRGNSAGWRSAETVGTAVLGVVALAAFLAWERRAPAPMLPLRLFRSRSFSAGNAAMFFLSASVTGAIFFTAQLFQVGQGLGPFAAGLRLLPWGVLPMLLAPSAGALADRIGARNLIVVGTVAFAAGMSGLALSAAPHASYLVLVGPILLSGAGLGVAIPAVTRSAVSLVAPPDLAKASGVFSTLRQLGGAFGVAIGGAVFAATGGYGSATGYVEGYTPAVLIAATLALGATAAGLSLPRPTTAATTRPAGSLDHPIAVD